MAATVQAQRVIDALCALGLTNRGGHDRDFRVATQKKRIRVSDGRRYSEFGDAIGYVSSRRAHEVIAENACRLADAGVRVIILDFDDGHVHCVVASGHRRATVSRRARDGGWETVYEAKGEPCVAS